MQTSDFEDEDYSPALPASPPATANPTQVVVPLSLAGQRLDQALAVLFPTFSRSRLATLVKAGEITIGEAVAQPKTKLIGGEVLRLNLKARDEDTSFVAEEIALNLVHEDPSFIVIDKPKDMVVHPAAGNWTGTLLNAMLFHYPETSHVPRAGIVHRLDKDTTGLMVIARTEAAQLSLVRQLQARSVARGYLALVRGLVDGDGTVDAPIGRHPRDRIKMAVANSTETGKPAITHYRALEQFRFHTLLECRLETGRTHQIRVHMASIGHALEGDSVYGRGVRGLTPSLQPAVSVFNRQALHARTLAFHHPETGVEVSFAAEIPDDFATLIEAVAAA
jgi:23S rRNA pseudouridine1911/1915/1917 synthase